MSLFVRLEKKVRNGAAGTRKGEQQGQEGQGEVGGMVEYHSNIPRMASLSSVPLVMALRSGGRRVSM